MKKILNYLLNKRWILQIVMLFLSNDKKEKIYVIRIKNELAFWGYDVSNMTNKDVKKGINEIANIIRKVGFTTNEIAKSFNKLAIK